MKLKCSKCGKREARLMSKAEIKTANFLSPQTIDKIIDLMADLFTPKYIVCEACGHYEKA